MKKIFVILISLLILNIGESGAFTVSVYIPQETKNVLSANTVRILQNKMDNIIKAGGAYSGNGSRYIIVPKLTIIDETTTATIPAQEVIKINIHYCVGDGIDGKLYDSTSIDYKGIGDNKSAALQSAINKIRANSPDLKELISSAEKKVIAFYNQNGQEIINEASRTASTKDYEKAIYLLMSIPSGSKYYDEAQNKAIDYSGEIINRDNLMWLNKAKSAWSASPNGYGASEAESAINNIIITNSKIQKEVNALIADINQGMKEYQQKQMELQMKTIESERDIKIAKTEANARIVSSIADGAATVISNLVRIW